MNKKQIAAVAAAGVVGLGASAAYASTMAITATGHIGAGSALVQSSCATNVNIHPSGTDGASPVWNATDKTWVYSQVKITGDFSNCKAGYKVNGTIVDSTSGAVQFNTAEYTLLDSDIKSNAAFFVNVTPGAINKSYLPATTDNLTYGLIVRSVA